MNGTPLASVEYQQRCSQNQHGTPGSSATTRSLFAATPHVTTCFPPSALIFPTSIILRSPPNYNKAQFPFSSRLSKKGGVHGKCSDEKRHWVAVRHRSRGSRLTLRSIHAPAVSASWSCSNGSCTVWIMDRVASGVVELLCLFFFPLPSSVSS